MHGSSARPRFRRAPPIHEPIDLDSASSDTGDQVSVGSRAGKKRRNADSDEAAGCRECPFHSRVTDTDAELALRLQQREELINAARAVARRHQQEEQHASAEADAACVADAALARRLQQNEQHQSAQRYLPLPRGVDANALRSTTLDIGASSTRATLHLPLDLVLRSTRAVEVCGARKEPLLYLRNVDGHQGRLVADHVSSELHRLGIALPTPDRCRKQGIVCDWHKNKKSRTPWRTGISILGDVADQLLACLSQDRCLLSQVPALAHASREWNDAEVLVTTPGSPPLRRHTDAQPGGSLLLVFCAGLSCRSQAWPGGRLVEQRLHSGDVMIVDGRLTPHAIPEVIEGTSPLDGGWLTNRRLAVLVRQPPPGARRNCRR